MRLVQHLLGNVEDFYKTGIYKISFSDKPEYAYIGSAFSTYGKSKSQLGIYNRLNQHLGQLKRNKHSNSYLQRVFNNHSENIIFEVVEVLENPLDRESIESLWMEKYRKTHTLLNLTPETKLSGRLNPLHPDVRKRMSDATSKALKGKIPMNLSDIHLQSRRQIKEFTLDGIFVASYPSLKDFSNHYNLSNKYCSFYLRKQNTIPKLKEKVFEYISSEIHSDRSGLQFKVTDELSNTFIVNSLNKLSVILKTKVRTLNSKGVQEKSINYKNYTIWPLDSFGCMI